MLKRLVPVRIKGAIKAWMHRQILAYDEAAPSFSHCGEDRILAYLFKQRPVGFYVDVGAFQPIVCSNTFLFYLQGWRGMNLDAFPGSMQAFRAIRPHDVNLEVAISDKDEELVYYKIGDGQHQMNGFSLDFQSRLWGDYGIREEDVTRIPIRARPLSGVLAEHLPAGQPIDFMSVDVEGLELKVLSSNDWRAFRPVVLMVEHHAELSEGLLDSELLRYVTGQGYRLIGKTPNELLFLAAERRLTRSGVIEYV